MRQEDQEEDAGGQTEGSQGERSNLNKITLLLQDKKEKEEALQRKRDEAERKARRGEIDPTHEFTFLLIGQVRS